MGTHGPNPDDRALQALRRIARDLDPQPPWVAHRAVDALSWRRPGATLATLSASSPDDGPAVDGTVPATRPHAAAFEGGGITIRVEIAADRTLAGSLAPPDAADVEVRWPGGSTRVQADERGRFSAADVPAGPVTLRCHSVRGTGDVITDWITL